MIRRILDLLGSARSINEDITSDALRIAALEAALSQARNDLARAIQGNAAWADKWEKAQPFIISGQKRKAADKRAAKRRRK